MKIAFLGKGGSGKSTLATAAVRHLHATGKHVLAIDADHNMDLSFNLGADGERVALGSDPSLIKQHLDLPSDMSYADVAHEAQKRSVKFRLNPPDAYTSQIISTIQPRLSLIMAGPHTDIVRSGEHCSHSLAAPLKVYLPLLELGVDEAVVIDERAGTDPVATGILKGVDLAVIVAEPTVHSVRVAGQIAAELELAQIPHVFVANKVRDDVSLFE
ncbi:MAG: AAA family ATPase, partial [Minisyncoccia bacterium]